MSICCWLWLDLSKYSIVWMRKEVRCWSRRQSWRHRCCGSGHIILFNLQVRPRESEGCLFKWLQPMRGTFYLYSIYIWGIWDILAVLYLGVSYTFTLSCSALFLFRILEEKSSWPQSQGGTLYVYCGIAYNVAEAPFYSNFRDIHILILCYAKYQVDFKLDV